MSEGLVARERSVGPVNSVILGFVLPVGLLLAAAGLGPLNYVRLLASLSLVGAFGLVLLVMLHLERIATSTLGALTLAGFLGLGVMALVGQLLGAISDRRFAWMICLLLVIAVVAVPTYRARLGGAWASWGRAAASELTALWFTILCLLGISARVFSIAAVALVIIHVLVRILSNYLNSYLLTYLPMNFTTLGVLVASIQFGWQDQAAWAFALTSADVHIFVNGAWAVDLNGWGTDPLTYGVNAPYHFLAQAMAGLLARIAGISSALSVILVIPVLLASACYAALRSAFVRFNAHALAAWLPCLVLLVGFSVLEPNTALSSESFTHQVSVGFLVILLPILQLRVVGGSFHHRIALVAVAAMALSSKIFTGATVASVIAGVVLVAIVRGNRRTTVRILGDGLGVTMVVGLLSILTYVPNSSAQLFRMELGFRTLDHYWELVGSRYPGATLAAAFLAIAALPILIALACFIAFRDKSSVEHPKQLVSFGILIGSAGTLVLGLVTFFPPAGYAERYFISNALLLVMFVGLQSVASEDLIQNAGSERWGPIFSTGIALVVLSSLFATARLWADRYQSNPSRLSFAVGFLTPYVVIAAISLLWTLRGRGRTAGVRSSRSAVLRAGLASVMVLLSIASSAGTLGYGMRGSLKSLVGVINGSVSIDDFGRELKESTDTSRPYVAITSAVKAATSQRAVLATNYEMTGQLFLSSASERQLWWSSYTGNAERRDADLTEHLIWRRQVMERFGIELSTELAQAMRSCGVTHYVLYRDRPINLETMLPLSEVRVLFQDNTAAILELGNASTADRLPNPRWAKWCGNQPVTS